MVTSLTHPCNFEGIVAEETEQAKRLAKYIKECGFDSVLDVGCGPGNYVTEMRNVGIDAHGVDIDPRCKDHPHCTVMDITKESGVGKIYPLVLSLEVGEHIPEELSWRYVQFLVSPKPRWIIFSAAIPNQGGDGHINCQYKSYWVHRLQQYGYVMSHEHTHNLVNYMRCGYHMGWFIQNAMIFTPSS